MFPIRFRSTNSIFWSINFVGAMLIEIIISAESYGQQRTGTCLHSILFTTKILIWYFYVWVLSSSLMIQSIIIIHTSEFLSQFRNVTRKESSGRKKMPVTGLGVVLLIEWRMRGRTEGIARVSPASDQVITYYIITSYILNSKLANKGLKKSN